MDTTILSTPTAIQRLKLIHERQYPYQDILYRDDVILLMMDAILELADKWTEIKPAVNEDEYVYLIEWGHDDSREPLGRRVYSDLGRAIDYRDYLKLKYDWVSFMDMPLDHDDIGLPVPMPTYD